MVSLIVTCFNQTKYISDCLNSVINQSYQDWECIIVNDGSTDNSENIIKHLTSADSRFQYLYQKNQGVAAARNTGLNLAKGEFIQFLDGDDILQKNKIENQVNYLLRNSIVDIVYGSSRYFVNSINNISPLHFTGFCPTVELQNSDKNQIEVLNTTNICTNCAALYRRSIIDDGIIFKNVQFEDWLFNIECSFHGFVFQYVFHENSFALVRMNNNGLMIQHQNSLENNLFAHELALLQRQFNFLNTHTNYSNFKKNKNYFDIKMFVPPILLLLKDKLKNIF